MVQVELRHLARSTRIDLALDERVSELVAAAAREFVLDPELIKCLHKGKLLSGDSSIASVGFRDGSKVMIMASDRKSVDTVANSVSDPTIRGFDAADQLERARAQTTDIK